MELVAGKYTVMWMYLASPAAYMKVTVPSPGRLIIAVKMVVAVASLAVSVALGTDVHTTVEPQLAGGDDKPLVVFFSVATLQLAATL